MQRTRHNGVSRYDLDVERILTWAAPLLDDVEIKYAFKEFDGNFMDENIYRQNGSSEVDAAWEALGVDCTFLVCMC